MDSKLHFNSPNSLKTKKTHFLGRKKIQFCSEKSIIKTSERYTSALFFHDFPYVQIFAAGAQNQVFPSRYIILARRRRKNWGICVYKTIFLLFLKHFEPIFIKFLYIEWIFPNSICTFFDFGKVICTFLYIYMYKKNAEK